MIVNAFLVILSGALGWMLDLLPDVDLSAFTASVSSGAGAIGAYLGHANAIAPVTEVIGTLRVLVALYPVFFSYTVFKWIWRHIPTIAGFGTGDG